MDTITVFRQFLFVRETEGPNRGRFVDAFNQFTGAPMGSSWCASALCFVLWMARQGSPGLPITASTEELRQAAKAAGLVVMTPLPGDIVLSIDPATGMAHHVALVTVATPLTAIAGNTSADGTSSNGDRVAEHQISALNKVFVRLPTPAVRT